MIKVGDKVKVITGTNKGKEGKVSRVLRSESRVVIEGINVVKKHVKPGKTNETGGILEVEAPIHISNVKLIKEEAKASKPKAKEAKVSKPKAKKENK